MTADELLEKAKVAYCRGASLYREAMIEAGRALHEFILATLRESDSLKEAERLRQGVARGAAILRAAEGLRTNREKIKALIVTAMVVDLLSGGNLGGLCHATIFRFGRFIRRRVGGRKIGRREAGESKPSDSEVWEVKAEFAETAPALFRRAVAENFTQEQTSLECRRLFRQARTAPRTRASVADREREQEHSRPAPEQRQRSAAVACPKDVAEMCLELVEGAEDPEAVVGHLKTMLDDLLARRKKRRRAWAG